MKHWTYILNAVTLLLLSSCLDLNLGGETETSTDITTTTQTMTNSQTDITCFEKSADVNFTFSVEPNSLLVSFDASGSSFMDCTVLTSFDSFQWSYGDGSVSKINSPESTYAYKESGTYTVTLTVNVGDQEYSASQVVTVSVDQVCIALVSNPTFTFEQNLEQTYSFDASESFVFENCTTSDPAQYAWDFGDGTTLTSANALVEHTFMQGGDYEVTLTIMADGAPYKRTQTVTVIDLVQCEIYPSSYFISSMSDGFVNFDASNTTIYSNNLCSNYSAVDYHWDFGDGNNVVTTDALIAHQYEQAGTYDIVLTAISENGLTAEFYQTLNVDLTDICAPSQSDLMFDIDTSGGLDVDATLILDVSSDLGPHCNASEYNWDFGDGTMTTTNSAYVTHQYSQAGEYDITVTNSSGQTYSQSINWFLQLCADGSYPECKAVLGGYNVVVTPRFEGSADVNFEMNDTTDAAQEHSYKWQTNDGQAGIGQSFDALFTQAGEFEILVTAKNTDSEIWTNLFTYEVRDGQCFDPISNPRWTSRNQYNVNDNWYLALPVAPPQPHIRDIEINGFNVMFNSDDYWSGCDMYDGVVWDFGDGTTLTSEHKTVTHDYELAGEYVVTMSGYNGSDQYTIVIEPEIMCLAIPNPQFEIQTIDGLAVTFDAQASTSCANYEYQWDFGDGNVLDGLDAIQTHQYQQSGTYTVSLSLAGTDQQFTQTVTVGVIVQNEMVITHNESITNKTVSFSADAYYTTVASEPVAAQLIIADPIPVAPPEPFVFTWDFGDQNQGYGQYVNHTYAEAGTYTVSVTAVDQFIGDSKTQTFEIVIE